MENRKQNWALGVLWIIMAACLLAGCSGNNNLILEHTEESSETETRLKFFGYKYEALNVMAIEDALYQYMDDNPEITISYDGIKSPEYFEILEKRLSTGNEDDIFMVDHERVLELEKQGKLADLSDLSTLNNFSELAKSQMMVNGVIDYVPTLFRPLACTVIQSCFEAITKKYRKT